jgi:PDZ domain-containing secreted protein/Zn-dependent protease
VTADAGPRPLFSPRGIPVRAEASLWVIAALVTWSFWSRFTTSFTGTEAIAMALVATATFLVSILAHELAHALEARRRGLAIDDITLYVFGGATRIVNEASSAADEFWLTVVGPWTSIVLGCGFGLVAYGADSAGIRYVGEVAGQLGWLNVLLGVFNLLPGVPLDGGRLLDSIVWRVTGDRSKAIAVSTRAGQLLGAVIVMLGVAELLSVTGGFVGGLWLMLIGWFLVRGASTERAVSAIRVQLAGLTIGDLVAPVATVSKGCSVATAADLAFRTGRTDAVAVDGHSGIVGIATGEALQRVPPGKRQCTAVEHVMIPASSLATAQASAPASEVLALLASGPIVVFEGRKFNSVLTAPHLMAASRWLSHRPSGKISAGAEGMASPMGVSGIRPPRHNGRFWVGMWAASGAVVLASLAVVPMPAYDIRPGAALNVPPLLSTGGPNTQPSGQLLMTTVSLSDLSAIQMVRAWFEPHHEIVQRSSLIPADMSPGDYGEVQLQVFRDSTRLAAAIALNAAGYSARIDGGGAVVRVVGKGGPADGKLEPGDIITAAAGHQVVSVGDLIQALQSAGANKEVTLVVYRGDQRLTVRVQPEPPNAAGVPVLDVAIEDALPKVTLPFKVEISRRDIGGPSAGLMTALGVYTITSGDDLTRGRKIAGTGTIDRKGDIGPVGGVAEKVVAAANAGATLFLVPTADAQAAREAAQGHGISVVPVASFSAALEKLRK